MYHIQAFIDLGWQVQSLHRLIKVEVGRGRSSDAELDFLNERYLCPVLLCSLCIVLKSLLAVNLSLVELYLAACSQPRLPMLLMILTRNRQSMGAAHLAHTYNHYKPMDHLYIQIHQTNLQNYRLTSDITIPKGSLILIFGANGKFQQHFLLLMSILYPLSRLHRIPYLPRSRTSIPWSNFAVFNLGGLDMFWQP